MRNRLWLVAFLMLAVPGVASAYIGPGTGITAIGSFLALLGGIVLAIVGFIWFPIKRWLLRARSESRTASTPAVANPLKTHDQPR
jgi:hypothetical protein